MEITGLENSACKINWVWFKRFRKGMITHFEKQIYRKYQNLVIHITEEKKKLIRNIRDIKETLKRSNVCNSR